MAVKVVNIYELLRDSKLVDAISQLKPKLDAVGEWTKRTITDLVGAIRICCKREGFYHVLFL